MKTNIKLIGSVIVLSFSMLMFQTCFAETGKNSVIKNNPKIIPGMSAQQADAALQAKQNAIGIKKEIEDNSLPFPIFDPDRRLLIDVIDDIAIAPVGDGTIPVGDTKKIIGLIPIPERSISEKSGTKISLPNQDTLTKRAIGYFSPIQTWKDLPHTTPITGLAIRGNGRRPSFGASFFMSATETIEDEE